MNVAKISVLFFVLGLVLLVVVCVWSFKAEPRDPVQDWFVPSVFASIGLFAAGGIIAGVANSRKNPSNLS